MRLPRYIDRPGEDLAAKCRRLLGELKGPTPMPETEVIGGPAEHVGPLVDNVYWWQRD